MRINAADQFTLYNPPDVGDAYDEWGCNCGPAALAAIIRVPCEQVHPFFRGFAARPYINVMNMQDALSLSERRWRYAPSVVLPQYGLAFIQIVGPWDQPGVPVAAAYKGNNILGSSGGG